MYIENINKYMVNDINYYSLAFGMSRSTDNHMLHLHTPQP
jgi:hypothetical protein